MRNVSQMATFISKKLIEHGFTVQRLNSETAKSVYLKLDYGLCNSIRISDHVRKNEYSYRFNILRQMPQNSQLFYSSGIFPKYFYSFDMVDKLVEDILERRRAQIKKYGNSLYLACQEKAKIDGSMGSGFWQKSKILNQRG